MPILNFPYRRPFYVLALTPQEIEEDLAHIITNTKRSRPRKQPVEAGEPNGGGAAGGGGGSGGQ